MTDYGGEQEMEIEALQAILMDEFEEADEDSAASLRSSTSTTSQWYKITISPKGDDEDEPTDLPVRLALYFAHTPQYPDEKPSISARSLQGVRQADIDEIQAKLEQEAEQSLGMAMIYTLVTTAKDWLREKYGQSTEDDDGEDAEEKEEVIEAHGLPVTPETFIAWRERFEAEQALEKARLMPDSALGASKEKRLTGREWFVQRALKGAGADVDDEEAAEDGEDIDYEDDFEDEDIDEDELLEHYLEEKGEN